MHAPDLNDIERKELRLDSLVIRSITSHKTEAMRERYSTVDAASYPRLGQVLRSVAS